MFNIKMMIGLMAFMLCASPAKEGANKIFATNQEAPSTEDAAAPNSGDTPSAPQAAPANPTQKVPSQAAPQETSQASSWEDFHASCGNCSVKLPASPEHVSEKIQMPDSKYELKYDAFISEHNKSSVYMLLVAQYPEFVDSSYAQSSLEAFLNGILSYNPANQLIFADLSLVDGHEALDFFIRAGAVYFKGRAILVKNSLYLMAMECEIQDYDEPSFNMFINSFSIKH